MRFMSYPACLAEHRTPSLEGEDGRLGRWPEREKRSWLVGNGPKRPPWISPS